MVSQYTKNLLKATKGCQKVNKGRFLNVQYHSVFFINFQALERILDQLEDSE